MRKAFTSNHVLYMYSPLFTGFVAYDMACAVAELSQNKS